MLVNLVLLLVFRYIFAWEGLYQLLPYHYFLMYLLEDRLPLGRAGYHLMLVLTNVEARLAPALHPDVG